MSNRYQVEALLRPPVELWSAIVALVTAGIAVVAPWAIMMPKVVAWGAAAILGYIAIKRFMQAASVITYQRNLRRLPVYSIRPKNIPTSKRRLFLGKGFLWEQRHTQRLRDTLKPEVKKYIEPGKWYKRARRLEQEWENTPVLRWAASLFSSRAWWNPLRPLPPVGGKALIHAVEPDEQKVYMDLGERVGHTLVLGTTRVGKTRLAEVLITQDIHRGDVTIVFDPKGDADLMRRVYAEAKRAGREREFYAFHLGYPNISARYNAIGSFNRITEVATRIANQLPDEGNSAAFKEFAWRFTNIIARALVSLSRRPDYQQIRRHINDIEPLFLEYGHYYLKREGPENWAQDITAFASNINERDLPFALKGRSHEAIALMEFIRRHGLYDPVLDGLQSAFKYDRSYFDKIVSSVGPLMEKLTTGKVAELISPNYFDTSDPRPIFDWKHIIRSKGIVYVGLDALSDVTVSGAVGNSMFADLVSVAGELYKFGRSDGLPDLDDYDRDVEEQRNIHIHADEFNELIGDEFIPMVNKSGGAGMTVTAYTQTWSDIEAKVGSRAKAGQITGNFNTLIMMRVKEPTTAELLTEQLQRVEVHSLMTVSGVSDSSSPESTTHFTSRNEDRLTKQEVPMILPSELIQLPKGQAFALLEGGNLWKLRLPMPDASHDPHMPENLESIAAEMQEDYTTNENWARIEAPWWKQVSIDQSTGTVSAPAANTVPTTPTKKTGLPETSKQPVEHEQLRW